MYKLVPLKFCCNYQEGGGKLADFIPYEEHHLMKEEKKTPIYCPDTHPFLCNKTSIVSGLCRRREVDCNITKIINEPNRFPIEYKRKGNFKE